MATETLVKALTATAELMGTELTIDGARMMCADLSAYPEPWVLNALRKCRREVTGRLTLAAIVSRIDDGHPGVEEAWAMMPRGEAASVVWTDQMASAFGITAHLLDDPVAARMAFKEAYSKAVQQARDENIRPRWWPSLGHDPHGREAVIREAVARGRLDAYHAQKLLPSGRLDEGLPALPGYVADAAKAMVSR